MSNYCNQNVRISNILSIYNIDENIARSITDHENYIQSMLRTSVPVNIQKINKEYKTNKL